MPEITIVITAYNLQAYLDQCLQEFMAHVCVTMMCDKKGK